MGRLINEEQQRINQYSLILNMKNCNLVFDERKSKNIIYLEYVLSYLTEYCYDFYMIRDYYIDKSKSK